MLITPHKQLSLSQTDISKCCSHVLVSGGKILIICIGNGQISEYQPPLPVTMVIIMVTLEYHFSMFSDFVTKAIVIFMLLLMPNRIQVLFYNN